ncbi:hypothetical protein P7K49_030771 [Saguinus oedipus]|uniref:CIDE-N domain-containing protein n=1 Tax=Saguinus oedipus TaxID=9490 RepID=A0ABQ9U346_SAGOE|nr:hypothetical protein P7K49_030771 [Saguinus oedipus]
MEYAMKSLSLLYPKSLSRRVAVCTSVVTQQLLSEPSPEAPRPQPCRVSTADRSMRKGIVAYSLEDLLLKPGAKRYHDNLWVVIPQQRAWAPVPPHRSQPICYFPGSQGAMMWGFTRLALWLHRDGRSITDLIPQIQDTLMLADKPFLLVLEEDGTIVETEEYFQALAGDTVFMVLQKGQKWQPPSEQVRSHLSGEKIRTLG